MTSHAVFTRPTYVYTSQLWLHTLCWRKAAGNARSQSSQLAGPLRTDPGLKEWNWCAWAMSTERKSAGRDWFDNLPPKSSCVCKERATIIIPHTQQFIHVMFTTNWPATGCNGSSCSAAYASPTDSALLRRTICRPCWAVSLVSAPTQPIIRTTVWVRVIYPNPKPFHQQTLKRQIAIAAIVCMNSQIEAVLGKAHSAGLPCKVHIADSPRRLHIKSSHWPQHTWTLLQHHVNNSSSPNTSTMPTNTYRYFSLLLLLLFANFTNTNLSSLRLSFATSLTYTSSCHNDNVFEIFSSLANLPFHVSAQLKANVDLYDHDMRHATR